MTITRRAILASLAAGAAVSPFLSPFTGSRAFAQAEPDYKPEDGATLRVLRWSPFVKGEEDAWLANTKRFTDATGVKVRIDKESWEDIRPKAAVAANVGSGPDIIWVWFDDAHQYPDS
jgi:multiple sugar transport system substrate-binding protein